MEEGSDVLRRRNDDLDAIVVQCIEVYIYIFSDFSCNFLHCSQDSIARSPNRDKDRGVARQIRFCLQHYRSENRLYALQAVAAARFVLSVVADCIVRLLDETTRSLTPQIENLLAQAKTLCVTWNDSQLHFFLLKQLVRRKGLEVLALTRRVYVLQWLDHIIPSDVEVSVRKMITDVVSLYFFSLQHGDVIPDYCIAIGPSYQAVREAAAQAALTGTTGSIQVLVVRGVIFQKEEPCSL